MIRRGDRVVYDGREWDVWDEAPPLGGRRAWWLVADDGTTWVDAPEWHITPVVEEPSLFGGDV